MKRRNFLTTAGLSAFLPFSTYAKSAKKAEELGVSVLEYRRQQEVAIEEARAIETAERKKSGLFSFESTPATSQ